MEQKTGKPVLFMEIDGTLYPVAMSEEQYQIFEMTVRLFSPVKVIKDKPQGKAINLLEETIC